MDNKDVKNIAKLLTDDPDIFNEMAVGTGAIAMGPAGNMPTLRTRKKKKRKVGEEDEGEGEDLSNKKLKKYYADPVTGQPKDGEVLYADTQSEEPEGAAD